MLPTWSRHDALQRLFWFGEAASLLGVLYLASQLSSVAEWRPLLLVVVLLVLAVGGDRLSASVGSGMLSPAQTAIVLTICLLGPVPAVCFGLAIGLITSGLRRLSLSSWLNNLTTFALFPFAGWALITLFVGDVHDPRNHHLIVGVSFGLLVLAVSVVTITVNFLVVALDDALAEERSLLRLARESFIPILPGHLAAGVLAGALAVAYTNLGLPVLVGGVAVLGTFHYLITALLRSEDRANQLEARSIHLANLQVGVLRVLMEALALRDRLTSQHAAAVARYAKALAIEVGCDEEEQEVVHTAALLHDIGKFTWSDRVLHPEQLTDADWEIIRRHPEEGATLVGKLDGYGAVAEAILYHHERIDGGGYPAGLIGNEIPLASRIIAICSTYDTMTASPRLGSPLSHEDALVELRKGAGQQFDRELVEAFIALLDRDGVPRSVEGASHETEVAFGERARRMAKINR